MRNTQTSTTTEQAPVEYATPAAQLDAALAQHEQRTAYAAPTLPSIEPVDPAAEASLAAKITDSEIAEIREIALTTGAMRHPEKVFNLTAGELNALRSRPVPTAGQVLAVIFHPANGKAIAVGSWPTVAEAEAWWNFPHNRWVSNGSFIVLVTRDSEAPRVVCAAADAGVGCSPACWRSRGADCERPLVTGQRELAVTATRPNAIVAPSEEIQLCGWAGTEVDARNGRREPGDPERCSQPIRWSGEHQAWRHRDEAIDHPVRFGRSVTAPYPSEADRG